MRPLDAMELLTVWERGLDQPLLERALALLAAACPETDPAAIAQWRIGERDARLLQLREEMFGPHLVNTASCPQCTQRVEWENRISDLHLRQSGDVPSQVRFDLKMSPYHLRFRLPTSIDIEAVLKSSEGDAAPRDLLKRMVLSAQQAGEACDPDSLPEDVLTALERRIGELDPQADIRIQLTCPQCSHRWEVLFDIAGFLWAEINFWAERTLLTVDKLASAYGWSEREILNLSPVRRQLYLGIVHQ